MRAEMGGRHALASLVLVTLVSWSGVSNGATAEAAPTQRVKYEDLDLAQPADVATLHRRLGRAAQNVCRSYLGSAAARVQNLYIRCIDRAMESAVVEVDNPALTARYVAAGGRIVPDWKVRQPPRERAT